MVEVTCASIATSFIPIIVILIFPLHWRALRLSVAFASGALIADVFAHQLPEILQGHSHDHSGHEHAHGHAHNWSIEAFVTSPVFKLAAAMILSYLVDGLVYSRMAAKAKAAGHSTSSGHGHSHGHDSPFTPPASPSSSPATSPQKKQKKSAKKSKTNDDDLSYQTTLSQRSASAAIVDLCADTMHNFTDGLSLGAAFLQGARKGWATTLPILLHELPHELGDGALLVRGGWSRWEAAKVQCWTGLGNLLGCLVILLLNPDRALIEEWVNPMVAGSFLYVALVGMLGELKEVPPMTVMNVVQLLAECMMFLSGWVVLEYVHTVSDQLNFNDIIVWAHQFLVAL